MTTWGDATATWADPVVRWNGTDDTVTLTFHGHVSTVDVVTEPTGTTVTVHILAE